MSETSNSMPTTSMPTTRMIIYNKSHSQYAIHNARPYQHSAYQLFKKMRNIIISKEICLTNLIETRISGRAFSINDNHEITILFPAIISELLCEPQLYSVFADLIAQYMENIPHMEHFSTYEFHITDNINWLNTRDGLAMFINLQNDQHPIWDDIQIFNLMGYINRITS